MLHIIFLFIQQAKNIEFDLLVGPFFFKYVFKHLFTINFIVDLYLCLFIEFSLSNNRTHQKSNLKLIPFILNADPLKVFQFVKIQTEQRKRI